MSDCIHGLDDQWCATCLHGPERPERQPTMLTTTAKFVGRCPECRRYIGVGDTIGRVDDAWLCADCIEVTR